MEGLGKTEIIRVIFKFMPLLLASLAAAEDQAGDECSSAKIQQCLFAGSHACWRMSLADLLPPAICQCETAFNDTFKAVDERMAACLQGKGFKDVCPSLRSVKKSVEIKRQRREAYVEKVQQAYQPSSADGSWVPTSVLQSSKCWDDQELACMAKCPQTNEIDNALAECDDEHKISEMEHAVGMTFSQCVQAKLIEEGLRMYFHSLQQRRKENSAAFAECTA